MSRKRPQVQAEMAVKFFPPRHIPLRLSLLRTHHFVDQVLVFSPARYYSGQASCLNCAARRSTWPPWPNLTADRGEEIPTAR